MTSHFAFGAQLYTVRAFTQTESDFTETIRKVAEMGYKYVQISAVGAAVTAQFAAEVCASQGVGIVVTHTNPMRIKDDTEAVIAEHKCMGAGYVGIGSMPQEYRTGADGVRRFIADYRPAAEAIKAAGLKLMYHNHDFEFEKFDNTLLIDYLINAFAPEELGFILDTYWVQAAGGDPSAWLSGLSGRVDVVHFKDMKMQDGDRRMCEVMEGNLNWQAIFNACETAGVRWAMIEQDDCYGSDPFHCLRTSYNNLIHRGHLHE